MPDYTSFQEKLKKKHQERLASLEKRRQERLKVKTETNETAEIFLFSFNKEKREITTKLSNLHTELPRNDISLIFEAIAQQISTLQKFVSDSSSFLPSYELRRAQDILSSLRSEINEERERLLPRKKFSFKSRQHLKAKDAAVSYETTDSLEPMKRSVYTLEGMPGFFNKSNETLILNHDECNLKDINLSNIENCVVYIYGSPTAMRVRNVFNSTIYCGPVSRAIFINDCLDSTFHLACQQLRIHSTFNTTFFIHITSKAIIEDCEEVKFGCFRWTYENLTADYKTSGLNTSINNWEHIDDFNWLKSDEQSPNWELIIE